MTATGLQPIVARTGFQGEMSAILRARYDARIDHVEECFGKVTEKKN
jgi:hypothetical protein